MPHSLFLGSGVVQTRLRHFDILSGNYTPPTPESSDPETPLKYRPSIHAIKSCLKYSIVDLSLSLFTFALFVNSAILIVAGASLSNNAEASENADLFSIYALLNRMIGKAAGTLFALALLLSGSSAGIVCTIAGQMVSEGMLNWTVSPWVRRLLTRSISITPSIIIAGAVGREGLNAALNASQVVLSVILPFVSAPLIYFTCRERYMTVSTGEARGEEIREEGVVMRNGWVVAGLAVLIWLVIAVMNVALLVLVGMGKA
jgi:metal iron transporter